MSNKKIVEKDLAYAREKASVADQIIYEPPALTSFELPRLKELKDLDLLKLKKEEGLDRSTQWAADIFNVPVALITLIYKDFQWFKSCYGTPLRP